LAAKTACLVSLTSPNPHPLPLSQRERGAVCKSPVRSKKFSAQPHAMSLVQSTMPDSPWYADGLRFECTGCGRCCTGAPGYVWVTRQEIADLAAMLDVPPGEFERRYTRRIGTRTSLIELAGGDCVFFDGERRICRVYQARPRQCRTWPFWRSNLKSAGSWREMASDCPGADRGRLFTPEEIERLRGEIAV